MITFHSPNVKPVILSYRSARKGRSAWPARTARHEGGDKGAPMAIHRDDVQGRARPEQQREYETLPQDRRNRLWHLRLTFKDDTETTFTNLLSNLVVHSNNVARPTATARTGTCRIGTCSHQTGGRVSLTVVSHGLMR